MGGLGVRRDEAGLRGGVGVAVAGVGGARLAEEPLERLARLDGGRERAGVEGAREVAQRGVGPRGAAAGGGEDEDELRGALQVGGEELRGRALGVDDAPEADARDRGARAREAVEVDLGRAERAAWDARGVERGEALEDVAEELVAVLLREVGPRGADEVGERRDEQVAPLAVARGGLAAVALGEQVGVERRGDRPLGGAGGELRAEPRDPAVLARREGVVEAGLAEERRGHLQVLRVAGVRDALGRDREAVQVVRRTVEDLVALAERPGPEESADRMATERRNE